MATIDDVFELLQAVDVRLRRLEAIERNKTITDPVAGEQRVYDDDGSTVLMRGDLWEDAAATQRYRGQGAERRERLELVDDSGPALDFGVPANSQYAALFSVGGL